jgi:4-hydroxythreonine-4-phosphate dehydrogenase
MNRRPRLALTLGDPGGVGPEVALACLADRDLRARADLLALGPAAYRPADVPETERPPPGGVGWHSVVVGGPFEVGRPSRAGGLAALAALRAGHELAASGTVDALVTAPVSKESLHLAGEPVEGQTELLARWADAPRAQMLAIAGRLRVLLLTRHLPLCRALAAITTEGVLTHLILLDEGLRRFGFDRPRLALAGLNPHAGENGLLGREELELLEPAVARARAQGLDVTGPVSPDTVFLRAAQGDFDAVLALYHDQAFIPVKLLGDRRGLTVLLGLPYLRVSPAHGTAFDLAGTGRADPTNLRLALEQAADWAAHSYGPARARA